MPEGGSQRRLAAIVAIDVAGYSRLMGADEQGTLDALKDHRDAMRPLVQQHEGRLVGTAGDGLLLEFPSVVEAVTCAMEVQAAMTDRNADIPEEKQMLFRVGINLGDVLVEGDDIYGDGVNVAARIEALAEPGGICISRSARDQVRDRIVIALEDMGEIDVKNIARPVRVFRVLGEGEAAKAPTIPVRPTWQKYAAGAVVIMVVITGGGALWWQQQPDFQPADQSKMAFKLPQKPSIAVLPFDYLGPDKQIHGFLADGLSENIIAALAQIPELFVIARNSTFTLKGKAVDVREVSEQFGVRYVLEGSVQRSGDKLRVTAQLLDGLDGKHLWADTFDRNIRDIFETQDDITKEIAVAMQVKIADTPGAAWRARGVKNLKAWALVMQADREIFKFSRAGTQKGDELSSQATTLEDTYAQAWALRAWVRFNQCRNVKGTAQEKTAREGLVFANRALQLEADNPTATMAKALLYNILQDFDAAIHWGERAISLAPSLADSVAQMSVIWRFVGEYDRAINMIEDARRLHPRHPIWYLFVHGNNLMFARRDADIIEFWSKYSARLPANFPVHLSHLTIAHGALGDAEKSRQMAAGILKTWPDTSVAFYRAFFPIKDKARLEERLAWLHKAGIPKTPPSMKPKKPAIAVLPFANLSGDKEQEYFADGMTDDLITDLSKLSGLIVIARNSVFTYKGKNVKVQEIAKDLNVTHVLEGSVRRAGEQLRINAQLIDAVTGSHLWAERFDRDVQNVFVVQDEIAHKIVATLKIKLSGSERDRISAKHTNNIDALVAYLIGWTELEQLTRDSFERARQQFEKAIELDADFAGGYMGMSYYHWLPLINGWTDDAETALKKGFEYAHKAEATDNSLAIGLSALGELYRFTGEYEKALEYAERAVALEPSYPDANIKLSVALASIGRPEEALKVFDKITRLDPHMPNWPNYHWGFAYFAAGRYEEAVNKLEIFKKWHGFIWGSATLLLSSYGHLGEMDKAKQVLDDYLQAQPNYSIGFQKKTGWPFKRKSDFERLIEGLQKAGVPE